MQIDVLILILLGNCVLMGTPMRNAQAQGDLLPTRYETATGKLFLTIEAPGRPLLYMNTLASGLGTASPLLDRGQVGFEALVRFERRGARVNLVRENADHQAVSDNVHLRRSVEESFPYSVLASFPIESEGPAGVVVDATDFFLSDVFDVVGRLRQAGLGAVRVDRDRSFIDAANTRAFPANAEIRAAVSYVTDDPHTELRRHAPDGRSITLQQQHSFMRLPDPPLRIRAFDPRAGISPYAFFDFAQGFDSDYRRQGLARWRLEPRDPEAYLRGERVEPVKPIIYYLDPGIPEPYRSAFVEGGMWWNQVFESAGWLNAFRIELLPPGADPLDARYPMIYWVHRQQRGPSVGPAFVDPRTGEILNTVVRMDSYRSLVNHDIYMGLLPAAGDGGLQLTAEDFAMARRRQHMAHEIGHTLGLSHNFAAATQGRSSVMDYPAALLRLDARGEIDISEAYRPSAGAHDSLAIRYAYTWYPTPEAEAAGLRQIVREAEGRGLRFVAGQHVSPADSYPAASQWIEGEDMISALERTMAVRRVLIERFDETAAQPGEPLAVLNRRFAHVYLHHRPALIGAIKYIGGMEFGYALRGEATEATRVLPAEEQRRALNLVLSNLEPAALRIPDRVTALIPPPPFGYGADLTLLPSAGSAFDPVATAHSLAQEIVDGLLHPQRMRRVVSFHDRDPANPSLDEVLSAIVDQTWLAATDDDVLRRVSQRAVLDGLLDLAGRAATSAEVRALVEYHLERLSERLAGIVSGSAVREAHLATAQRDIARYFEGRDAVSLRPRPAAVSLPWP